jgi:4-hydroxysphinganine ceramide fatty acyl 2-hydroxylase
MASLPIISLDDLASPNKCLVTLDNRVYDVSQFLPDHPGGADLIAPYRGKDVSAIMSDITSHEHSESAYEMLQDYVVGVLSTSKPTSLADSEVTLVEADNKDLFATGMSCEEDLNVPTDISNDYMRHKFLDLGKPLLPQLYQGNFSKEFYLQQVHRPRHYPNGSAPLMPFAWMEPFSKTQWWMVPIIWIPWVAYGTYLASQGLTTSHSPQNPGTNDRSLILCWIGGLFLWTLVEYGMHRVLFHVDEWLPDNKWFLTVHFLLHGVHHYLPTDRYRPTSHNSNNLDSV